MGVRMAACWMAVATGVLARACAAQERPAPPPPPSAQPNPRPPAAPAESQPPQAPGEPPQGPGMQQAPPTWTIELRGGAQIDFRADIDDTPGNVEIYRTGFGIDIARMLGQRSRLSIDLSEEVSWYLFDNATGLVPGTGDPFENVYRTTIRPMFSTQHDRQWSWFVGGIFDFSGEADADLGDSFTYGVFGGARYAVSEKLSLSFGIGGKSRLEESALLIPVIGFEWKVNDRVTVSADFDTGLRISAKMTNTLTAAIVGSWELREYRLADDAPVSDGIVRDDRIPVGLEVGWHPSPKLSVTLTGGAVVWQELRFDDSAGNKIIETNTDPTPFLGVRVRFVF